MTTFGALPVEILLRILDFLDTEANANRHESCMQACIARLCIVNRTFYAVAAPRLYRYPILRTDNITSFIASICPSINARVRQNGLAKMVRVLDLGSIRCEMGKFPTARLLSRVKESVEVFVSAQAQFGIACLPPLAKCGMLKSLNLVPTSEAICLASLFEHLRDLPVLSRLYIPYACDWTGTPCDLKLEPHEGRLSLPRHLKSLFMIGLMHDNLLLALRPIPCSLHSVTIVSSRCLDFGVVSEFLTSFASQIRFLWLDQRFHTQAQGLGFFTVQLPLLRSLTLDTVLLKKHALQHDVDRWSIFRFDHGQGLRPRFPILERLILTVPLIQGAQYDLEYRTTSSLLVFLRRELDQGFLPRLTSIFVAKSSLPLSLLDALSSWVSEKTCKYDEHVHSSKEPTLCQMWHIDQALRAVRGVLPTPSFPVLYDSAESAAAELAQGIVIYETINIYSPLWGHWD